MSNRIYIAGPIGKRPQAEYEAHFAHAADQLAALGWEPVNPVTLPGHASHSGHYKDYMREDLLALLTCDAIYMLQGWVVSPGALAEFALAKACRMRIEYEGSLPIVNTPIHSHTAHTSL